MQPSLVQQLNTYPISEWAIYCFVMLAGAWIGGLGGIVVSHLANFFMIFYSDADAILSQPGGDIDGVFWFGFFPRMISINLLLTIAVALPIVLIRKPLLRFDRWSEAFFKWRLWPRSITQPVANP